MGEKEGLSLLDLSTSIIKSDLAQRPLSCSLPCIVPLRSPGPKPATIVTPRWGKLRQQETELSQLSRPIISHLLRLAHCLLK